MHRLAVDRVIEGADQMADYGFGVAGIGRANGARLDGFCGQKTPAASNRYRPPDPERAVVLRRTGVPGT